LGLGAWGLEAWGLEAWRLEGLKNWKTKSAGALTRLAGAMGLARGTTRMKPLSRSVYSVTASGLDGSLVDLSRFDGQVTLIVNVASQCGFTPQYRGLQDLHAELAARGFAVLGFPSNEFGAQEPGDSQAIRDFCDEQYGVTFPMFARTETKHGPGQSPVYALLGESGRLPSWNFYKYLVDRHGQAIGFFPTQVTPDARELREAIARALLDSYVGPNL
jgi:glutathione peroxidase